MSPWYAAIVAPVVGLFRRVFRWDEPKVPDLREERLRDAQREVTILRLEAEQDRLKSEKAKRDAMPSE